MVATTLPAVVRVVDLPVATTITGAELFEVVQTTAGVGVSVQVPILAAFTALGGVPTGGATGTILNKSSGSNYSTQFSAINTFVNVGANLATTGTATSIVIQLTSSLVITSVIASTLIVGNTLIIGKSVATTVAPGAGFASIQAVSGTIAGTCKIIIFAGTSTTAITIVDNVGAGF
jgi:hypothetical protein